MTTNLNITPENPEPENEKIVPFGASSLAGLKGEFTGADIKTPFLGIIQGSGKIAAKFPKNLGDLVYAGETIVTKPVDITVYGARKNYRQNLEFGSVERALIFSTAQEVLDWGGNVDQFKKPGSDSKNFIPELWAFIALESNVKGWAAGLDGVSRYEKRILVPAAWVLRGNAYRNIVPQLRSAEGTLKKNGRELVHARFSLDTTQTKSGQNFVWVPTLKKQNEQNSEEFVALVKETFGE
jgi:hypothetical protein